MSKTMHIARSVLAFGGIALLAACAQTAAPMVAASVPTVPSNPPMVSPGPTAQWHHVAFDTNSTTLNPAARAAVNDVTAYLRTNPNATATIIGRADTVGSADYNMHLSHKRADVVRDALVYEGAITPDRVETRWTGETRRSAAAGDNVAVAANRVVDIAIH